MDNGTIEWEDRLPLETICELERIVGNHDEKSNKKISPWVYLVLISRIESRCRFGLDTERRMHGIWYLPEGIKALSFSFNSLHTNPYEYKIAELLQAKPDYIKVKCPSTLKKIKSPEYKSIPINIGFEFNEGLEEIGKRAFNNTPSLKLVSVPQNKINGHNIFGDLRRNFDVTTDGKVREKRDFSLRIRGINISKDLLQTYKQYIPNFEDYNASIGMNAVFFLLMRKKYGKYEDAFNLEIKNIELIDGETKFLTYELKKAQTCDDVLREINQLIEQRKSKKEER